LAIAIVFVAAVSTAKFSRSVYGVDGEEESETNTEYETKQKNVCSGE
jgi:hypothetical protein